jgi:hypothetical protein
VLVSGYCAALSSGLISGIENYKRCMLDFEIDGDEGLKNVAKDGVKGGAAGGANGFLCGVIRTGGKTMEESAKKEWVKIIAGQVKKANVAMALAALTISTGVTLWQWLEGEIDLETALSRLGENGTSCASGIFVGAAAGMIFGPVGAVVGSMAGYIGSACVYNSLLSLMRSAKLAEKQALQAKQLCKEAVAEMQRCQKEFKEALASALQNRQEQFDNIVELMVFDENKNPLEASAALVEMAHLFNVQVFSNFEEFDKFMLSNEPLRL